jgi:MFS family permease
MLCPLYISEMASPETRGSLISLEQFSIVLGVVLGFWAGFLTRSIEGAASWRIPLGIQIIPGVALALGTFWLPPSPRLLVLRGKEQKALVTLLRLRDRDEDDPLAQVRSRLGFD